MKEEKKRYVVTVSGCDDSTSIEKDLTKEQFVFLSNIALKITKTSSYACMPKMYVKEKK